MDKLRAYYRLAKPERTFTNILTALAGYLFASEWHFSWDLLALIAGSTLIIGSACVLNNYADRDMDSKMQRTKKRSLVSGEVPVMHAIVYATIMGVVGFWVLAYTNWLTFAIGAIAFVGYVVLYDLAKRHTVYGTMVGTIPGSASLVAGYTAVIGRLDWTALLLFIVMAAWQMAHFYAIAIYRLADYKAASIPVWPAKKGVPSTKRQILLFIFIFGLANVALTIFGHAGYIYLAVMGAVSLYWLWMGISGFKTTGGHKWARQEFKLSLIIIVVLAVMLAVGPILP